MIDVYDFLSVCSCYACFDLLEAWGKMILDNFVALLASFADPDFLAIWYVPLLCGYAIASVPGIIRLFTKWG